MRLGLRIQLVERPLDKAHQVTAQDHRLIINLPPRQLKSHCASIAFPA
jgi:hypothetical protein